MEMTEGTDQATRGAATEDTRSEAQLSSEITSLWSAHQEQKDNGRRTRIELKAIRQQLGEKLFAMKFKLTRTGRSGGWATFLREHHLPRATADRYVREQEATLTPLPNRLTDAISEPTEDEVRQFAQRLIPRLRRLLTSQDAVYYFFDELVSRLPPVTDRAA
jgi:hypothetical protein